MLREYYRCHPRIIQFCNQQFYDNQLIPMTQDAGEDALKNSILHKGGLPLLRLKTVESHVEKKVENFLGTVIGEVQSAG